TTLVSTRVGTGGATINPGILPATGTFSIELRPLDVVSAAMMVSVSEPVAAVLAIGGPATMVAIARAGQIARLSFDGVAGQRVVVEISNVNFANPSGGMTASVIYPNSVLVASTFIGTGG